MTRILVMLAATGCMVGPDAEPTPTTSTVDGAADSAYSVSSLNWPLLSPGDSNQSVTAAQYLLEWGGFPVPKTGSFDAATTAAVRGFQASRSIAADGRIGPQTWRELTATQVESAEAGSAVEAVQYLLARRFGANLSVTGTFGPTTAEEVRKFQQSKCLAPTAVVGTYTWNALIANSTFCKNAAARVLGAHQLGEITLWDETFGRNDGADPLSNIKAAAAGAKARTSCYDTAPCTTVALSSQLTTGMADLREKRGFRFFVTAIAGAAHAYGSLHYAGRAFDVDEVNGVRIQGDSATARAFMAACRDLGATEVLGPSNDAGHQDHVHCGW